MKLKSILTNIEIICLFSFILNSCIKNEEPAYYYISDEIKKYGNFKVGSYWIYKNDSVQNFYDSIYVVDYRDVLIKKSIDKKIKDFTENIDI